MVTKINVLLVEDDPMVREVNRQFIERIEGFHVIGMSSNGVEGFAKIIELKPEVVIMDIFMPEQDGLETLRKIRRENVPVDVITVTAANDMQTIQQILHLGVYDYIMKPFTFERIQKTLQNYYKFKIMTQGVEDVTQKELDEMIHQFNEVKVHTETNLNNIIDLPKGFNRATLEKVLNFIKQSKDGASADEVAAGIGVARVTARRYLDFLEKQKLLKVDVHYGGIGRPINQYFI
ncbi:regulator [Ureibacillus massiliensis 4400831 = CIP 108448 = CCUG 49529]|uniref:Transcriptional regulatory protein n=1 Tax=Ureibacillus massiliensis 4400831 = CIP 108448 = CCUG 49529 TaxID=1211035 RepID=A0A0A3ISC3_9BACL|nr:regulator [Ureibacillus massiliensis 4400831 = CIP 108448 = CCUG 49529]